MRSFISGLVLFLASIPVFAEGNTAVVPEPESIALIGIGALSLLIARRGK
jgi:hypothetical protein